MKRVYETPMAEKLAFCYRDQVVAASGEATTTAGDSGSSSGGSPSVGEQIIGQIAEGLGVNGCAGYECVLVANGIG